MRGNSIILPMGNPKKSPEDSEDDRIGLNARDEELEEWVVTSIKVLAVLKDEDMETYKRIYADFIFDLQRLKKAGRITDEDYEGIMENL